MAISNLGTAVAAGYTAFRENFSNPENSKNSTGEEVRRQISQKNWEFYTNEAYEDLDNWLSYFRARGMYQYSRLLYNPMRRLVDFYAGAIYGGRLSIDGLPFPNGVDLAIPLSGAVDGRTKAAIAQLWQWSNWQTAMRLMVRYGAVAGNVLVEVMDEPEKGRVRFEVFWSSLVSGTDLIVDAVGNVKQYGLQYVAQDENGKSYKYKKIVRRDQTEFYKDNKPFDYGQGEVVPNQYGFAPAVWIKHTDLGGTFGAAAFRGDFTKMDEANSLATHVHDLIHKKADPPIILWTKDKIRSAFRNSNTRDGLDAQGDYADELDVRADTMILKGSEGGRAEPLVGNLGIAEAMPWFDKLVGEMEKDHPELTFYEKLREMTQVTGPGAKRLMGDAQFYFDEAASNYDAGSIRLFQMGLAIAGERLREGKEGWFNPTAQQRKFIGFSLDSYERDELIIDIEPRTLVPNTEDDEIDMQSRRFDNANKSTFFPLEKRYEIAGIGDEAERTRLIERKIAETEPLISDSPSGESLPSPEEIRALIGDGNNGGN